MLKKILIALVVIVGVILVIAATKPATYTVVRSTTIKAPAATVYGYLDDFHKWPAWSPWEKMDPGMQRTYSGAPSGIGAVYAWEGNSQVGKGRMEITNSRPASKLDLNLDFIEPMEGHSRVEFLLNPTNDSTEVTWTMTGDNNFLSKIMQVFASMDKMIGGDFEHGLADLKTAAEQSAQAAPTSAPATTS